jgi:hypothetical protein
VLFYNCTGSRHSAATFITQDKNEGDAKMLGSIFDRPYRIRIDDVARVTGDKKFP